MSTTQGIDEELALAAESFLEGEDGCVLNMPKNEVSDSVSKNCLLSYAWLLGEGEGGGGACLLVKSFSVLFDLRIGGFHVTSSPSLCSRPPVIIYCSAVISVSIHSLQTTYSFRQSSTFALF